MSQQSQNPEASKVFISFPSSFPMSWTARLHRYATSLGLCPYIYHGIPITPHPQINNVEFEARSEMYSAKNVFAVMNVKDNGEIDGVWIIKYIPSLLDRGIDFDLGFVEVVDKNAIPIRSIYLPFLPLGVKFERYTAARKWLTHLLKEMNKQASLNKKPLDEKHPRA
jgi:hypothetical protein